MWMFSWSTDALIEDVLVTNVQLEEIPVIEENEDGTLSTPERRALAPSGNLLISVALHPEDAERLVFGIEHGTIWLGRQTTDIDVRQSEIQTRGSIYEDLFR